MSVAVLGAGPVGLMAAWAAERNGHEVIVYSNSPSPSKVNPDMYLQRPLPDLPGHDPGQPDAVVEYIQWGTKEGYALRCYGDPKAPVSWDEIKWGYGDAWWLDDVYALLWEHFVDRIRLHDASYLSLGEVQRAHSLVMSTLPAPVLCGGGHLFSHIDTVLVRSKQSAEYTTRDRNEMVYNGDLTYQSKWFRHSRLRGWRTFEYAGFVPAEELGMNPILLPGKKLTGNNCTCNPRIERVGRWAQWERGVLNHHAFEQATAILASYGLGKGA